MITVEELRKVRESMAERIAGYAENPPTQDELERMRSEVNELLPRIDVPAEMVAVSAHGFLVAAPMLRLSDEQAVGVVGTMPFENWLEVLNEVEQTMLVRLVEEEPA